MDFCKVDPTALCPTELEGHDLEDLANAPMGRGSRLDDDQVEAEIVALIASWSTPVPRPNTLLTRHVLTPLGTRVDYVTAAGEPISSAYLPNVLVPPTPQRGSWVPGWASLALTDALLAALAGFAAGVALAGR